MTTTKGILFLSIMDFTDKGIQVVRLTPEYFARHDWRVHYVVTRDNSKHGSYLYQPVVDPAGIVMHRLAAPSWWIGERSKNHLLQVIYSQIKDYLSIIKLVRGGYRVLRHESIDVIYGGGPHGVIAAKVLNWFMPRSAKKKVISRFYGVWDLYTEIISGPKKYKILLNLAPWLALYLKSDLKIITNDGTRGDKALKSIRSSNMDQLRFYVNGVNKYSVDPGEVEAVDMRLGLGCSFTAVCITRLVASKRADLCIKVAAAVVNRDPTLNFRLIVVGDGNERDSFLELAERLAVSGKVHFVGAVDNHSVKNYLAASDVFLSTYRVSNVGNPLLEAIRANKIILTLNNGDTNSWITHRENGFIYEDDAALVDRMASDIVELIKTPALQEKVKRNIKITENDRLWTWDERMASEFLDINQLFSS